MSMTTDDSTDDGYGGTASDDGSTYTTDDAPTTDDRYSSNAVEVETEVVADDNLGGDDQYAKLTQDDGETAEDDSTNVDSTDDGYIDDNLDYFDDDFVVDLPSEEDLKVVWRWTSWLKLHALLYRLDRREFNHRIVLPIPKKII